MNTSSGRLGLALIALVLLTSCGGGKPAATPSVSVLGVTISPTTVTLDQGATHQFTATITGSANTAVVWKIYEGSAGGSIDAQGLYTAPAAAGAFHVVATSAVDASKNATATVSVNSVAISVSPGLGDMEPGATQAFTATVTGSVNHDVTWSVLESAGGSITKDGMYTAPAAIGTFHVVATSAADSRQAAAVAITVATLAVLISPRGTGMQPGNTRSFTASVSGCIDDRVIWTVQEGSTGGVITSDGVYTAPAGLGQYHVVATSVAHPSVSGSAMVLVGASGFTAAGNMTMSRVGHTATLLPSGDVLLVSGGTFTDAGYSETASAELFDHRTSSFKPTGAIKTARELHTATLLLDGKVLIAGGGVINWDYFPVDAEAELYDPATGQFTSVGKLHVPRLQHTATLLANGKVLIAGGYKPDEFLATAELYDPATGTFTPTGSMSKGRAQHTATLLPDGRVLVMGGCQACTGERDSVEIYDPSAGVFVAAGAFNRIEHTATLLDDGRIFAAGGYSWDPSPQYVYYDDAQFFSTVTGQSSFAAKMNGSRFSHTATKLRNGQVLLIGGWSKESESITSTAELFDGPTGTFVFLASMSRPRSGHTATLLSDGRVLVTGGTSDKTAELYTQQP